MPLQEWVLRCDARVHGRIEDVLIEAGALSVTLLDADAGTAGEVAVLEPGVGETPIWPHVELLALFDVEVDRDLVESAARSLEVPLTGASWRAVADQAWERAWLVDFHPMRFGTRTFIVPSTHAVPEAATALGTRAAIVRLDPGLAFGTGTHPTTALCLEWLDALELGGRCMVDFGCGSGVLAVAALKLGASRAIGIDNDPQALLASRDNATRNDVGARIELYSADALPSELRVAGAAHAIVANILAGTLIDRVGEITTWGKPGAAIALSGILPEQAGDVAAAFAGACGPLERAERDGWIRLSGRLRFRG